MFNNTSYSFLLETSVSETEDINDCYCKVCSDYLTKLFYDGVCCKIKLDDNDEHEFYVCSFGIPLFIDYDFLWETVKFGC